MHSSLRTKSVMKSKRQEEAWFSVERTQVIIQLPVFSKNGPLKNTLEASERHAIPLQHKTGLRLATLSAGDRAFINYTYLLMQNMYFKTQKEMTQQPKNKNCKNVRIENERAWEYTCVINVFYLWRPVMHFCFEKPCQCEASLNVLFFLSLLFCFGFFLPSCKSLVKVLFWQVKIIWRRHYWQPCGTEEKRSERGQRRLSHSIPIQ